MADRLKMNFKALKAIPKSTEVQQLIREHTDRIAKKAEALGSGTKTDFEVGPKRVRGAVMAGYENSATAEKSRRNLLSAMDGE